MAESEKEGQQEVEEVDEEEEEYVLLDMDTIAHHIRIPENAPYVLTVISLPQLFLALKVTYTCHQLCQQKILHHLLS